MPSWRKKIIVVVVDLKLKMKVRKEYGGSGRSGRDGRTVEMCDEKMKMKMKESGLMELACWIECCTTCATAAAWPPMATSLLCSAQLSSALLCLSSRFSPCLCVGRLVGWMECGGSVCYCVLRSVGVAMDCGGGEATKFE